MAPQGDACFRRMSPPVKKCRVSLLSEGGGVDGALAGVPEGELQAALRFPCHRYICRQLSDRQVQQAAAATSSNAPVVMRLLAASWTVAIGDKAIHTPVHGRGEHSLVRW